MLKSMLGGDRQIKQLFDILSNAEEIKKMIETLKDQEVKTDKALSALSDFKTFEDYAKSKLDDIDERSMSVLEREADAEARENRIAIETRNLKKAQEQLHSDRVKLDELRNEHVDAIEHANKALNERKADLDTREEILADNYAKVETMHEEYATKLKNLQDSVASLKA